MSNYLVNPLSKFQCGFWQGFNAQQCLLALIEILRRSRRSERNSNRIDCIAHNLVITKLRVFGFGKKSLAFISTYLRNRKQKIKVGLALSDFLNILYRVPLESI